MTNTADIADDRLKILVDQLDAVWELLDSRLCERLAFRSETGSAQPTLTDDEYFWEPAPGCWSLHPRDEAPAEGTRGKGEWVLEGFQREPQPAPITTIAWRICHVANGTQLRYDYTFGSHSMWQQEIEWPSTAADALAFLTDAHFKWRNAVAGMTGEELDQIGRSQFPGGLDPNVRFIDLLAWTNLEFAHHAAEIACLRDLYRATPLR